MSNLNPTGTHPFETTNGLSFSVTSPGATIANTGIGVTLDGVDVSSHLQLGGSGSTRTVGYPGLQLNAMHTAVITVTNSLGHGIRLTNSFDTFSQDNYMVETEDFDYDSGQVRCQLVPERLLPVGTTTNVDYHHTSFLSEQYTYRSAGIPEDLTHDFLRDVMIGNFDYDLTWFGTGDWANFTRSYPAGDYYVYGRFSGLGDYSMYLDRVVSGVGTLSQVTQRLGRFGAVGRAYNLYDWVPLRDQKSLRAGGRPFEWCFDSAADHRWQYQSELLHAGAGGGCCPGGELLRRECDDYLPHAERCDLSRARLDRSVHRELDLADPSAR